MFKTTLSFPRLHHLGGAVVSALLLLLFLGPASTRSSEPESRATLPLHLDRHFQELVQMPLAAAAPVTPVVAPGARERYLSSIPFGSEIRKAARSQGLDSLLVVSVVEAESAFRADAVSPKGALGLMQLLPLHFEANEQPFDPAVNLAAGAGYLAEMKRRFDGDLELALAAYHAGPSAVERFGGLPPYRETRQYVGRVLELYREHQASVGGSPAAPDRIAQRGS